ncbi:MAG: ABC transporter substrate-binding protein [Pseudomonadota bacterium]
MRNTTFMSRLVLGLVVAGSFGAGSLAQAQAPDQVAVQLDYVVRGNHAMFFVAKEKGFYAQNGIDVTAIRKGSGSNDALKLVANGNAQFGFSDLPTLMVARTKNIPATALVAVNQKSPLAMLSIKSKKPLRTPQDLKGMNIGVHPSGSTYVFLKAFFAKNGLSFNDVTQSTVAPPYENYLVLGRVDAVPGYIDAEVPELENKTGGPGSLSILQGSDFGLVNYGSGVFTSDKMIAEKPDLVQRFTNAYMQAFKYVIENPTDAVNILVKMNPEYKGKEEMLFKQLDADIKYTFFSADSKTKGIGWISPAIWAESFKSFKELETIDKAAVLSGGYDSRFVEKSQALRR